MATGSEVVTQDGISPVLERIRRLGVITIGSPEEAQLEIAKRIMGGASAEDVLADQSLPEAEELIGQPLQIEGVSFLESDYKEGLGVYALIEARDTVDGSLVRFTCGGTNVISQLARLAELNAFPVVCALVKAPRQTAAGYWPLWLKAVTS